MFTGLIQGLGRVDRIDGRSGDSRLTVVPLFDMGPFVLGESIAVNGACLTVEALERDRFTAYASKETLGRTNIGQLRAGGSVNLEKALALGDRLGGHLVTGHVDCMARVSETRPSGQSRIFRLTFPPEYGRQIIAKGSVALDGVSLTVNDCGEDYLEVNIIPSTWRETTIAEWRTGRSVNMETDIIGKYVERMVRPWTKDAAESGGMTVDFLRRHGF
ncbi:MAG: riboflavin synthase [Deltaproteobacteria bacterium]|nr:riboflavin synthase [Deltaproteobacteria bacterium]